MQFSRLAHLPHSIKAIASSNQPLSQSIATLCTCLLHSDKFFNLCQLTTYIHNIIIIITIHFSYTLIIIFVQIIFIIAKSSVILFMLRFDYIINIGGCKTVITVATSIGKSSLM